jgi:hypothetical protein
MKETGLINKGFPVSSLEGKKKETGEHGVRPYRNLTPNPWILTPDFSSSFIIYQLEFWLYSRMPG